MLTFGKGKGIPLKGLSSSLNFYPDFATSVRLDLTCFGPFHCTSFPPTAFPCCQEMCKFSGFFRVFFSCTSLDPISIQESL